MACTVFGLGYDPAAPCFQRLSMRAFDDLDSAIRYVMERVPPASRVPVYIADDEAGEIRLAEIEQRYAELCRELAKAVGRAMQNEASHLRATVFDIGHLARRQYEADVVGFREGDTREIVLISPELDRTALQRFRERRERRLQGVLSLVVLTRPDPAAILPGVPVYFLDADRLVRVRTVAREAAADGDS